MDTQRPDDTTFSRSAVLYLSELFAELFYILKTAYRASSNLSSSGLKKPTPSMKARLLIYSNLYILTKENAIIYGFEGEELAKRLRKTQKLTLG